MSCWVHYKCPWVQFQAEADRAASEQDAAGVPQTNFEGICQVRGCQGRAALH